MEKCIGTNQWALDYEDIKEEQCVTAGHVMHRAWSWKEQSTPVTESWITFSLGSNNSSMFCVETKN